MAINRGSSIRVEGLTQFRRELGVLGRADLLKQANVKAANLVVDRAQGAAGGVGRQAAKAARTLTAANTGVAARVVGGGGLEWFYGAEFGATRWHQFKPHRGTTGYFLFPTIRKEMPDIINLYGDELLQVARAAFPS